jgi:hypothetical protein
MLAGGLIAHDVAKEFALTRLEAGTVVVQARMTVNVSNKRA